MAKKIIPALNKETISGLQEMRDLEVSLKKGIKKQEKRDNSNKQQATEIKKTVKKQLGLTAVGGLGGNNQGYIAANLQGKNNSGKSNKFF